MDMIRIGPALPGMVPFFKNENGVGFDGQGGRQFDFGHTFDMERGYRVFFRFKDSPASNTWGGESLLRWAQHLVPADAAQRDLKRIATRLANQVIRMNREWDRLGRPVTGISTEPVGRA